MTSIEWVSVRSVYETSSGGKSVFEERVTIWRVGSLDDAISNASSEAVAYAESLTTPDSKTEFLGLCQAYALMDTIENGAEVFSLLRRSDLDRATYLNHFFDTGNEIQTQDTEP